MGNSDRHNSIVCLNVYRNAEFDEIMSMTTETEGLLYDVGGEISIF